MNSHDVDITKVSPMMQKYLETKRENPDVILFYRLGDFYEMFFEDATLVSKELELVLTGKSCGLEERVPMCGVPHHSVNIYIEKLIEKGYKVAICEQLEDPKKAKGIVKRGIIQIVSKGTNMDQNSLKEYENNYIGNLVDFKYAYGISYADISTGEINTFLVEHDSVLSEIANLGLKEVILTSKVDKMILNALKNQYQISVTVFDEIEEYKDYQYIYEDLKDERLKETIKHLLTYIQKTQMRNLSHLQKAVLKEQQNYLKMDVHTKRNLELTETLRLKERMYSLIWLLDKTKTAMGSRLLKNYIEHPLVNKEEIEKRYNVVETLLEEFVLKDDLQKCLNEVYDLERLSGRIAFGSANARDLLQLKRSLKVFPMIQKILKEIHFEKGIEPLEDLYVLLEKSIYEEPPITIKEGSLIKDGYHQELDELKSLRKGGKEFIAKFEQEEKERTGIKNLRVGYNRVFGYYIEVSKGNTSLIKEEYGYERKQTLANAERYISPILKEKESLILNAEEKIIDLEYELFTNIREEVKKQIPIIQENAKVISEIDVLQAFSTVTEENHYIRPTLTDKRVFDMEEVRHPVVEKVSKNEFVPNDIKMDEHTDILLITGPNMAGKSTYMRQVAISVIMAQIGCFIPAKKAIMPIFDAIYTRIGASDDLVSGESTFMVEMKEANYAIQNATKNSLILFDELGRGTATFDGMALAQSIIEYISKQIGAKTFFSTHYHELTDLEESLSNLKNIHVSAHEENGNITFLHKMKEGSIDKSYGIHVAKLADLPTSLIERANQILSVYERNEQKRDTKIQESFPIDLLLEEQKESEVERKIDSINPLEVTPMDALQYLFELKELRKKK